MRPSVRHLVAGGAVLVVLAVVAGVLLVDKLREPRSLSSSRPGGPYAEGPPAPRLVVLPDGWTMRMFMQVEGSLVVNEQGCVSRGNDLVVAMPGTRVAADGSAVVFPGNLVLPLHTSFVGGGGYFGGRRSIEKLRGEWGDDLVDAVEACLGPDGGGVLQVWLDSEGFG